VGSGKEEGISAEESKNGGKWEGGRYECCRKEKVRSGKEVGKSAIGRTEWEGGRYECFRKKRVGSWKEEGISAVGRKEWEMGRKKV